MIILACVYLFIFSLVFSMLLIPLVRRLAIRYGVVAYPKEDRHHQKPTPLLGGVAIIVSFYLTILFNLALAKHFLPKWKWFSDSLMPYSEGALMNFDKLALILFAGLFVFVIGLVDDLKGLGPKIKFVSELAIGAILFSQGLQITAFGSYDVINFLATVVWVTAITNAFNLLDNIDGLAGGVTAVASFILLGMCLAGGQVLIVFLLLTFLGAVLGFLRYNYPPATIFMGDSGSLFLGFMMSTLMMMSTFYYDAGPSLIPVVAPLMILSVPIYDTLSVIFIRIKNGKSIFVGDKNHFSHRLLKVGMNDRQAVTFILLVGLCTGISALTLVRANAQDQGILLVQTVLLVLLIHFLKNFKQSSDKQDKHENTGNSRT